MNLMDCFNTFQNVSKAMRLSPNARSLYIAILGEFNSARYPETLNLSNSLLRDMSGINLEGKSDSSFHSARNALQNAGLIKHKQQVYQLTPNVAEEKLAKRFEKLMNTPCTLPRDSVESAWRQVGDSLEGSRFISTTLDKEEVEKENRREEEDAQARVTLSKVSEEVERAWTKCKGSKLDGQQMIYLTSVENARGSNFLVNAIETASMKNDYGKFPNVTFTFLKMTIEDKLKGSDKNDTRRNDSRTGSVATTAMPEWESREFDEVSFKKFLGE